MKTITRKEAEHLVAQIIGMVIISNLSGQKPEDIMEKGSDIILKKCGIQEDETKPAGKFKLVEATD